MFKLLLFIEGKTSGLDDRNKIFDNILMERSERVYLCGLVFNSFHLGSVS